MARAKKNPKDHKPGPAAYAKAKRSESLDAGRKSKGAAAAPKAKTKISKSVAKRLKVQKKNMIDITRNHFLKFQKSFKILEMRLWIIFMSISHFLCKSC